MIGRINPPLKAPAVGRMRSLALSARSRLFWHGAIDYQVTDTCES